MLFYYAHIPNQHKQTQGDTKVHAKFVFVSLAKESGHKIVIKTATDQIVIQLESHDEKELWYKELEARLKFPPPPLISNTSRGTLAPSINTPVNLTPTNTNTASTTTTATTTPTNSTPATAVNPNKASSSTTPTASQDSTPNSSSSAYPIGDQQANTTTNNTTGVLKSTHPVELARTNSGNDKRKSKKLTTNQEIERLKALGIQQQFTAAPSTTANSNAVDDILDLGSKVWFSHAEKTEFKF